MRSDVFKRVLNKCNMMMFAMCTVSAVIVTCISTFVAVRAFPNISDIYPYAIRLTLILSLAFIFCLKTWENTQLWGAHKSARLLYIASFFFGFILWLVLNPVVAQIEGFYDKEHTLEIIGVLVIFASLVIGVEVEFRD